MIIAKGKVITLAYQLFSLGQNQQPLLVEERTVDNPLEFLFGHGQLMTKVEEAIEGHSKGFQTQINLHPNDAFGTHRPELLAWMDRSHFPKNMELKLGMKFQTQGIDGQITSVIVKEIDEDKVLVDGNHPLAGLSLRFELNVLRVREAKENELATGEVDPKVLH